MPRPLSLFTGQWADLPLDMLARKAARFGYEGLELACWGDHFDVRAAPQDDGYCRDLWALLARHGLRCWAVSHHLVGQAVCDPVDRRHRSILPAHVWGDGDPDGVRARAAEEMVVTGRAARRFFDHAPADVQAVLKSTGRTVVVSFTGSPLWHAAYAFPPLPPGAVDEGYAEFARAWTPTSCAGPPAASPRSRSRTSRTPGRPSTCWRPRWSPHGSAARCGSPRSGRGPCPDREGITASGPSRSTSS